MATPPPPLAHPVPAFDEALHPALYVPLDASSLLSYYGHPATTTGPPRAAFDEALHPALYVPLDASSPGLAVAPGEARRFFVQVVHLGLVLLLPLPRPKVILPHVLAFDLASAPRALLPPLPHAALPDDRWRRDS
ncbi:hypothetical protein ACP70R_022142 [Stipagrostis hirtigluma subsp. patula]